jgi:hypothetical protein
LPFELIQIWMFAQYTCRKASVHNELLS